MSVAVEVQQDTKPLSPVNGTDLTALKCCEVEEEPSENIEETENCDPNTGARAKPKWTYSKEELFDVQDCPSAKIWPAELSEKYMSKDGIWDPEMWYYSEESEKRSASPIDSKKRFLMDGFVLSPQGRSFARGCQIASDNKFSVGKQSWNNERDGRNKMSGRVGRGWDQRERSASQRGRVTSPVGKYEKNTRDDRYPGPGKGRRRTESYDSQPEWFTCGPINRTDTMELKGFEDSVKRENKRKKRRKEISEDNTSQRHQAPVDEMFNDEKKFDINEFFDIAENALPISGVYENQMSASRFSQWFSSGRSRSGSHNSSRNNSRRSSFTEELAEIAGLTLSSPARTPTPPDAEFMFAPIVPASEPYPQDIHQDPEIDVQPLLDSVIPHKTVKGAVNLEELEGEDVIDCGNIEDKEDEKPKASGSTEAFNKLVETMKASGNLPEKPTPTIPDIPPHLLPRPPSSRDKSRSASPSLSRSPSPLQLLQNVIRQSQSPVNFVGAAGQLTDPRVVSHFVPNASPVPDIFSTQSTRPLTPDELYGVPPPFSISAPDLFEFTGSLNNTCMHASDKSSLPRYISKPEIGKQIPALNLDHSRSKTNTSGYPVISQSFVPTSVLRKLHSDKQDHKSTEEKERKKDQGSAANSHDYVVTPQRRPLFDLPNTVTTSKSSHTSNAFSENCRADRTSPHEFATPKRTQVSPSDSVVRSELLTPHHLPLPRSPVNLTPHSLPLPSTPLVPDTLEKPAAVSTKQQLLTPRSLPLPHSPLLNGTNATSNDTSSFGIRPLPKPMPINENQRSRNMQDIFKRPSNQSARQNLSGNNFRRLPACAGQPPFSVGSGMVRRPVVPSPYNVNAANLGRVHPTALALALRNQQYQMARAAAVAAATAAVNRAPMMSPAQATAAALMLNQQRAAFHGLLPQVNPQMFHQVPLRPNLPPALQHQHHVVHRSEPSRDNSLSKWFSPAVLNQSQSQPAAPGRGATVLSVEELERHA